MTAFSARICAALMACFCMQGVAAQVAGTDGVTSVYQTGSQEVAAYDATAKSVRFFSINGVEAKEIGSVSVPGQVMGVLSFDDSYVIATGMGRGDLTPPLRVGIVSKGAVRKAGATKSDATLQHIYERITERPQFTQLRVCAGAIWLGFFQSKYETVIGQLKPSTTAPGAAWEFSPKAELRMGDSFDCIGEQIFVGRSYGDVQGQDGDLLLMQDGKRTLLPSYRGVRGVQSIGDASAPMLAIGDGWHSNYGQFAQGRISLLHKQPGEQRFRLEILDLDPHNFNFTKFSAVTLRGVRSLVALGSSEIVAYSGITNNQGASEATENNKRIVYTQISQTHLLDFAVGSGDPKGITLVVADAGLRLIRVE
jgi:hypothetical protein